MSTPGAEKDHHDRDIDEKGSDPSGSERDIPQDAKILEVKNADYALALSTGPQLSPTSWRSFQLYAILLVAFMGSLSNGFDGSGKNFPSTSLIPKLSISVMSAVNGMEYVISKIGIARPDRILKAISHLLWDHWGGCWRRCRHNYGYYFRNCKCPIFFQ